MPEDDNGTTRDEGPAAAIESSNATSITVTTPPHAKGKVDVVITNAGGQQHVLKEAFEYVDTTGSPGAGADKPTETVTTTAGEGEDDVEKIDGCDVDIEDETPDEDLPMTEGGVR